VVLRPFLSAVMLALILSFSTWPLYRRLEQGTGGRKGLASLLMVLIVAAVLILPLVLVGASLADDIRTVIGMAQHLLTEGLPDPPGWVANIPLVGSSLYDHWEGMAGSGTRLSEELAKYLIPLRDWGLHTAAKLGTGIAHLMLSVFIAFFFYRDSDVLTGRLRGAMLRVDGERGADLLRVAGNTIKSVIYGIMGTALAQGFLTGVGLLIAGVPGALLLGALTCVLSLIPFGSSLAWLVAAIWLLQHGAIGHAIFLIAWGLLVVSTVDNFLRPYFISKGSNLPFILVFLGGLGGILAFGFLGIFIGPTLLAIAFSLFQEWSARQPAAEDRPPPLTGG
jgi:predicted PurR-regulated permease PerM